MSSPSATITTLLVANRGEIARRVMRTASAMGIRTVAVFSEADADAPHVHEADIAVALGGSTASESYLDQEKILRAAAETNADAVHPGYGFLSENAGFARACAAAGLVFVGPSPESVETMGLKDRAKSVARAAGVPTLPDARITDDDPDAWRAAADTVGYPLLVKAVAGGGGKGMRQVNGPAQLVEAVEGARREAGNSFGNADVFLERYLSSPRHIEVQVFADTHGNSVYLHERECSVQRRHQKVIEEAPSSVVDAALRERMGKTAVALVRELGYVGAGTVEYLLDDSGPEKRFYFLEMNTRLQVEHPVTEEITGLDLVRLQLQVAAGRPLGFGQEDVTLHGHALEVRLYAEDPAREFAPAPGLLHRYRHAETPGLRWEDGIGERAEVSPFYDPMLAKVVAHAPTREEAALRLARALAATELHGTVTNRDFLVAALRSQPFLDGETRTDFIDLHPGLCTARPPTPAHIHLAAAVAVTVARRRREDRLARHAPPTFRILPAHPDPNVVWESPDGTDIRVTYRLDAAEGEAALAMTVDGTPFQLQLRELDSDGVRVRDDDREWPCRVVVHDDGSVWVNDPDGQRGWRPRPRLPEERGSGSGPGPVADIAGTVVEVRVAPGDRVTAGQRLVVVEAMKMELPVLAATDGIVEAVHVEVGQYVDARAVLVTLKEDE
ncbi:ATP-grasp domain-containing protein [Actinoallomurus purpureus]|uniref:acetyl/propionyl/methylcrotonyl-CoA carboxylase subunit alpha n=1 Tax=Actinoallomurus purpureus TaxID=478114 RepID=UPI00209393D5|nr:biotin carboxylase N-terminal domain-containing protein [Actinoallomurus purpureus]MCO6010451.1 ATP-grasp domain-containing protein [Actinoallomurus purpureus]